jgi:CcmD family protein
MGRVRAAVLLAIVVMSWSVPARARTHGTGGDVSTGRIALTQAQPSDEFVPVSQLPETERLPAAPLLIGAYSVVWLVLLVYLLSLWRRMGAVDREIADLERRVAEQRRA